MRLEDVFELLNNSEGFYPLNSASDVIYILGATAANSRNREVRTREKRGITVPETS